MTVGTINFRKTHTRTGLAAGASQTVTWNNPPEATVLTYFAYAKPPVGSGPHSSTRGEVEITRVVHEYHRDNDDGDSQEVRITVKNVGDQVTGYEIFQSWIVPA